jgi:hypothetical protein
MKIGDMLILRYFLCNSLTIHFVYETVKYYIYVSLTIRSSKRLFPAFVPDRFLSKATILNYGSVRR